MLRAGDFSSLIEPPAMPPLKQNSTTTQSNPIVPEPIVQVANEEQFPLEAPKPRQRRTRARTRTRTRLRLKETEIIEEYRSIAFIYPEVKYRNCIRTTVGKYGEWGIDINDSSDNILLHGSIDNIEKAMHKLNTVISETQKLLSAVESFLTSNAPTVQVVESTATSNVALPLSLSTNKNSFASWVFAALKKSKEQTLETLISNINKEAEVWEIRHSPTPFPDDEQSFQGYRNTAFLNLSASMRNTFTTSLDKKGNWAVDIEDCHKCVSLYGNLNEESTSDKDDVDPAIYTLTTIINEVTKLSDAVQERHDAKMKAEEEAQAKAKANKKRIAPAQGKRKATPRTKA